MSERASNNNNVEIFEKNESTTSDMDVFRYVKEKYQSQGIEVSTSDIEINSRIHALTEITKHTDQDISEFDKSKQSTDTPLENDELLSSHKEKVELLVSSYDEVRKEMLSIYSKISSD
ncbi:MAG: hypothetical protein K0S20_602, partial [Patescibacteria group bacterium]|nr:hypothetical protein [Patescibacteria group bacterium]